LKVYTWNEQITPFIHCRRHKAGRRCERHWVNVTIGTIWKAFLKFCLRCKVGWRWENVMFKIVRLLQNRACEWPSVLLCGWWNSVFIVILKVYTIMRPITLRIHRYHYYPYGIVNANGWVMICTVSITLWKICYQHIFRSIICWKLFDTKHANHKRLPVIKLLIYIWN
jgi:hypothetical protein